MAFSEGNEGEALVQYGCQMRDARTPMNTEFFEQALHIGPYAGHGDGQLSGDLFVCHPFTDATHNVHFARAEAS